MLVIDECTKGDLLHGSDIQPSKWILAAVYGAIYFDLYYDEIFKKAIAAKS